MTQSIPPTETVTHANEYLLEVGTEELPVGFLAQVPETLKSKVQALLEAHELSGAEIQVFVTPRRIVLHIAKLAGKTADKAVLIKGPPLRIGLDASGELTQAAKGFAKKAGCLPEQLQQKNIDGQTYLVFHQHQSGQSTRELLQQHLPDLILGMPGSHFMAWGNHRIRFSRPIRWLVSQFNTTELPLAIGPVTSGSKTWGHRLLANAPVSVNAIADFYHDLLEKGKVQVNHHVRQAKIKADLEKAAAGCNAVVVGNAALLQEVTMLVELATVFVGQFNPAFLVLPPEVIETVMVRHQKYFALRSIVDQSLLPQFLIVSNSHPGAEKTVVRGNEKVIAARLSDAAFFYESDQKTPLINRVEALNGITFQRGLGTMRDKAHRLEKLSSNVATALGMNGETRETARRAGLLAKADLVTSMVFELTELQGIMGYYYARASNEPEAVALAVKEHYQPNFLGDALPKTDAGIVVSLSDKMDSLVTIFAYKKTKLPSGSKDPLGLRRMVSGIFAILFHHQLALNLDALIAEAYANNPQITGQDFLSLEETAALLTPFMLQRLKSALAEADMRYDVINAVLGAGLSPFEDINAVKRRCTLLKQLIEADEKNSTDSDRKGDQDSGILSPWQQLYIPGFRVAKMLGEKFNAGATLADIDPSFFNHEAERALLQAITHSVEKNVITQRDKIKADKIQASPDDDGLQALQACAKPVEDFFDAVMVNDPDAQVRVNRYNLLSVLHQQYLALADFTQLAV
ncbi:MAG: glycine--tRNA ligase subunit beta [Cyanobacteria bacterium P01_H01_bin.74]